MKKNILVVDDEIDIRETVCEELIDLGYNALTAGDPKEAIKLLLMDQIDLVISDIRMPNGGGIAILDYVNNVETRKIPIIFVTGYADHSENDIKTLGGSALLPKPIDFDKFYELIGDILHDPPKIPKDDHSPADFTSTQFSIGIKFEKDGESFQKDGDLVEVMDNEMTFNLEKNSLAEGDVIEIHLQAVKNGETVLDQTFPVTVDLNEEMNLGKALLTVIVGPEQKETMLELEDLILKRQSEVIDFIQQTAS